MMKGVIAKKWIILAEEEKTVPHSVTPHLAETIKEKSVYYPSINPEVFHSCIPSFRSSLWWNNNNPKQKKSGDCEIRQKVEIGSKHLNMFLSLASI